MLPPHEHMIKKSVETTKIGILNDALAKANQVSTSLIDCVGTGSPMNYSFSGVLRHCLFRFMLLTGDISNKGIKERCP